MESEEDMKTVLLICFSGLIIYYGIGYIIENFDPVDSKSVAELQKALNANGYDLEEDGRLGKNTLDAVRDAQADRDKANQMVGPNK